MNPQAEATKKFRLALKRILKYEEERFQVFCPHCGDVINSGRPPRPPLTGRQVLALLMQRECHNGCEKEDT